MGRSYYNSKYSDYNNLMYSKVYSGLTLGIDGMMISVETDTSQGLPGLNLVGYLASSVKEAGERVRAALKNTGVSLPSRRITVNLSPADTRKDGALFDVAIAVGIILSLEYFDISEEMIERILEKQIGSMQEHMEEMEHIYSGIRSMKHDMKNTLSVIMQLATGNEETENAELQAYLSELNRTMDRLEFQFRTGNTVVDTLLNMKYHEAARMIPDMQMDADRLLFPDNLLIQSYDIGIILGNALDNAIEACRKLKGKEPDAETFIRLSSFRKGKMIFIEIANSFDGNVIRKRQAEFPVTDKADKEAHGIGLSNIKNAAGKYHGAVDWSVNNKVFTLSVMMQNERRIENEF